MGKFNFERRALKTNAHNSKGDNQGFLPKTVGTATDPAGDCMAKREEKGSRLDGREERAAEASGRGSGGGTRCLEEPKADPGDWEMGFHGQQAVQKKEQKRANVKTRLR